MSQRAFDFTEQTEPQRWAEVGKNLTGIWIHDRMFGSLQGILGPEIKLESTLEFYVMAAVADRIACGYEADENLRGHLDGNVMKANRSLVPEAMKAAKILVDRCWENSQTNDPYFTQRFKIVHSKFGEVTVYFEPKRGTLGDHWSFRSNGFPWDSRYRSHFTVGQMQPGDSMKECANRCLDWIWQDLQPKQKKTKPQRVAA